MKGLIKKIFKQNSRTTDDIDGGIRKRIDTNAPKTISCTKLTEFECTFSTLSLCGNVNLERSVFTLTAKTENDGVFAFYKSRTERFEFYAPPSFMDEVQNVIATYDFARFNGISCHVSGLPDMYGAKIFAEYESGEHIYSANNQDCFIPTEAILELLQLFKNKRNI